MIEAEQIGWWNTGFPLLILCGLAIAVPRMLISDQTRSQGWVALMIAVSALGVLLAGAAIFALVYTARGHEVGAVFSAMPVQGILFFVRLSAFTAMIWAPLLALVWFGKAQMVEKTRGEDVSRPGGQT